MKRGLKTLFIAFLILKTLQGVIASAVDSSEYQHQAEAKVFEVTPSFNLFSNIVHYKQDYLINSQNTDGIAFGTTFEYGFNRFFSVGLSYKYTSEAIQTDPTSVTTYRFGLNDPAVFLKLKYDVGASSFRAGFNDSYSIEKADSDTHGDKNEASGGSLFTPFLGFEYKVNAHQWGVRSSYDLITGDRSGFRSPRTTSASSISYTIRGGKNFKSALFYEYKWSDGLIGFDIAYVQRTATETTSNRAIVNNDDSYQLLLYNFYFPYKLNETVTLLPSIYTETIRYNSSSNATYSQVVSDEKVNLTFAVRLNID